MKSYPSILILLALPFVGCAETSPEASIALGVDSELGHGYFPMTPGMVWIYEGVQEGVPIREEIHTMADTIVVWGTLCSVMEEHVFLDNELAEVTYEVFGLDSDGNVWKLAEDSYEIDGGELVRTGDSWVAGIGGALPWIAFAADVKAGDSYSGYSTAGMDRFEVVSTTSVATVPAGSFENCLEVVENRINPDDMDIILYAPGVGRVSEITADGRIDLVSTTRRLTGDAPVSGNQVLVGPANRVRQR